MRTSTRVTLKIYKIHRLDLSVCTAPSRKCHSSYMVSAESAARAASGSAPTRTGRWPLHYFCELPGRSLFVSFAGLVAALGLSPPKQGHGSGQSMSSSPKTFFGASE